MLMMEGCYGFMDFNPARADDWDWLTAASERRIASWLAVYASGSMAPEWEARARYASEMLARSRGEIDHAPRAPLFLPEDEEGVPECLSI